MIDEVAREGDEAAKTLMRMTEFYVKAYKSMYPGIAGCGLHDPLAVAVAEDPSLARTERMFVDVELHGEFTRGQTIADRRLTAVALHNADVCMDIDRRASWLTSWPRSKGGERRHSWRLHARSMSRCLRLAAAVASRAIVKGRVRSSTRARALFLPSPSPPIVLIAARREFGGGD